MQEKKKKVLITGQVIIALDTANFISFYDQILGDWRDNLEQKCHI
jgi:hypothetical protein